VDSDRLKSSVTNGATTSAVCFNTDVGMGSAADVLSGSRRIALMTSSIVSGRNCRKETPGGHGWTSAPVHQQCLISLWQLSPQKNWLNTILVCNGKTDGPTDTVP